MFPAALDDTSPVSLACTVISVWLLCAISVGGGIGGGALYLPIFLLLTRDAHLAVPLGKITTNGVAWSAFIFNVSQRHPQHRGPLIDYDVALILEPMTLLGTIMGVILNLYATTTEILVLLVVVLSPTAYQTLSKGCAQRSKDPASGNCVEVSGDCVQDSVSKDEIELTQKFDAHASLSKSGGDFRVMPHTDEVQIPVCKLMVLIVNWSIHAALISSVGGTKAIICGKALNKVLCALLALVHLAFTVFWRHILLQSHSRHNQRNHGATCTYRIDSRTTAMYPALSCFAGVCAGGLGIAGGLIKGPLMLNWGLAPQASTATAIFMILFTSSSTILQFSLLGRLRLWPSVIFWTVGFAGGLAGSKVVAELMRRHGKPWMITISLGLLIVASALGMSVATSLRLLGVVKDEPHSGLCSAK